LTGSTSTASLPFSVRVRYQKRSDVSPGSHDGRTPACNTSGVVL
jgi:hypothetical protein